MKERPTHQNSVAKAFHLKNEIIQKYLVIVLRKIAGEIFTGGATKKEVRKKQTQILLHIG